MTKQVRETPEPLTPEEEAALRERHRAAPGYEGPATDVDRLLATIAALRATTPDPAADECERSDGSGLLCVVHGRALWPSLARRCNGAATPDPAEPGLDVGRVARTMRSLDRRITPDEAQAYASLFVERYAALSDTEGQS
jgi:hypothetical protein